jgi:hypothetical protein
MNIHDIDNEHYTVSQLLSYFEEVGPVEVQLGSAILDVAINFPQGVRGTITEIQYDENFECYCATLYIGGHNTIWNKRVFENNMMPFYGDTRMICFNPDDDITGLFLVL